jgi:hypothetical protein
LGLKGVKPNAKGLKYLVNLVPGQPEKILFSDLGTKSGKILGILASSEPKKILFSGFCRQK